jgi:hypothetical protein
MNLDSPIMVIYLNVNGLSSAKVDDLIDQYKNLHINGLQTIIIPCQHRENNVEIIWKGTDIEKSRVSDDSIKFLEEKYNILINLISDGISDEKIKQKLRDLSISKILE